MVHPRFRASAAHVRFFFLRWFDDVALTERLRGRRGVVQRRRRLAAEPLCRHCREKGRVTQATVPDHVIPLALGGSDDDDNIQCLCEACHAIKTAAEGAASGGAANHPDWLKPSAIPLTIVSGPPCSGKSTHVEQHARPIDEVIDLDRIFAEIRPGYRHWSGMLDRDTFNTAIRVRNARLGALVQRREGRAYFIVSAPSEAERRWWQGKLGGTVLLLDPGADECRRRALARGTPAAIAGIEDWLRAARLPWSPPRSRPARAAIGEDGWPVG